MLEPALVAAVTAALLAVAELLRLEITTRRERAAIARELELAAARTRFGPGSYMDAVDITEDDRGV